MTFRSLCLAHAVPALFGAVVLIVHPALLFDLLELPGDPVAWVGRLAGAMLLNIGLTLCSVRSIADRAIQRHVIFGNIACDAVLSAAFLFSGATGQTSHWAFAFAGMYLFNLLSWVFALRKSQ